MSVSEGVSESERKENVMESMYVCEREGGLKRGRVRQREIDLSVGKHERQKPHACPSARTRGTWRGREGEGLVRGGERERPQESCHCRFWLPGARDQLGKVSAGEALLQ